MSVASAVLYTAGQCTSYVASLLSWVPGNWGDAKDWLGNARAQGLPTSQTPVIGSIAVWGANEGGALGAGHVAVVTGVQDNGLPIVTEMNWTNGPGRSDTRAVSSSSASGIIGYILPPGTSAPHSVPGSSSSPGATTAGLEQIPVIGQIISWGQFLTLLTEPSTWFTVGWFIVAAGLAIGGVILITRQEATIASAARRIGEVAAA